MRLLAGLLAVCVACAPLAPAAAADFSVRSVELPRGEGALSTLPGALQATSQPSWRLLKPDAVQLPLPFDLAAQRWALKPLAAPSAAAAGIVAVLPPAGAAPSSRELLAQIRANPERFNATFDGARPSPQLELPYGELAAQEALKRLPELSRVKNLGAYRPPRGVRLKIAGARAVSGAAGIAAGALFAVGLGPVVAAAAAAIAWAIHPIDLSAPKLPAGSKLTAEQRQALLKRLDETSALLARRMGCSPESAAGVTISNLYGTHNAWAQSGSYARIARMGFGDDWNDLDDRRLAAVMGHELGHIHFRDHGFELARPAAARSTAVFALTAAVTGTMLSGLGFLLELPAPAWLVGLPSGPVWAAGAASLAWLSVAAAAYGNRAMETRADHFAGWLTRPEWLAEQMLAWKAAREARQAARLAEERRERDVVDALDELLDRVLASHPANETRAKRLTKQAARDNMLTDRSVNK